MPFDLLTFSNGSPLQFSDGTYLEVSTLAVPVPLVTPGVRVFKLESSSSANRAFKLLPSDGSKRVFKLPVSDSSKRVFRMIERR